MAVGDETPGGGTIVREVFLDALGEPTDDSALAVQMEVELRWPDGSTERMYADL